MNGFICTKGLALSGVEYKPGDHIPAEAVLPNRVRALINQSYITREGEDPTESRKAGSTDGAKLAALRSEVDELKAKNDALSEALEAAGATQAPAAIIIPLTADGGVYEQEAPALRVHGEGRLVPWTTAKASRPPRRPGARPWRKRATVRLNASLHLRPHQNPGERERPYAL